MIRIVIEIQSDAQGGIIVNVSGDAHPDDLDGAAKDALEGICKAINAEMRANWSPSFDCLKQLGRPQ